ncbi:MAG TPA: hypothetical protein PK257_01255 [Candidatus Woesebacteria bacterium]|nr:hypothetical protein [Candidatus Woesebacteria bacterium]
MIKIIKKNNYFEIIDNINKVLILTKKYKLGINVYFGERIKICNNNGGPMDSIIIGDNVQIHHDSTIMVPSFSVLDYTKINNNFYAYGTDDLNIGYNCWFGSGVILDTLGGLKINNNVGIGSQVQIYSHAKFGDTLYGCKINTKKKIDLNDDVWITPGCIITMASLSTKSMLLSGSVLTKDTVENHIYAGVPAIDITDKIGFQFNKENDFNEIYLQLKRYLDEFYLKNSNFDKNLIEICLEKPKKINKNISYFVIKDRKYTKISSEVEIDFIKFLLPDRGKFIPY